MSEALDRPHTDADAWATACAEDLAAEKTRRRQQAGLRPGSAADELRKLAEAVTDRLAGTVADLRSPATDLAAQAVVSQVKAVAGNIRERNPAVFEHLSTAGFELLAAYRAVVAGQESRWTQSQEQTRSSDGTRTDSSGPSSTEHIDLD